MILEITVDEEGRLYQLLGWNNAGQIDVYFVRNEHIKDLLAVWINTFKTLVH